MPIKPTKKKLGRPITKERRNELDAAVKRKRQRSDYTPDEKFTRAIGAKVNGVRKQRGLTVKGLALKLGISPNYCHKLCAGRVVPGPEVQARIIAWATQNISWETSPGLKHRWARKTDNSAPLGWRKLVFWLPRETRIKLRRLANNQGYSQTLWVLMAIDRMLADEIFIHTARESLDAMGKARMTALVNDYPMIRDILQIDVAMAKEIGLKFPERSAKDAKVHEHPAGMGAITSLVVADGVATRVDFAETLWKERLEEI